ncbi:Carbohydrate esterase family 9 protein [Mycena sanguinolenta]|uniref:Carbohydrate esterase family 9 protein n=1 Tax=Mycena sanguinolenta TaxID=230812 RepID=A0A8H6YCC9_9AGAR|nr:Carbohydrate esterase family 9 protein [Mycena sanguinolenta]
MSSAAPTEQPPTQPPSDSLFPLANYTAYPPYFPGAQPNTSSVFPTLNNLPFSDLAMGSNEDVLNALQNLDITKIAGVLKTLTDAADAANIPLATIGTPSTNMQHVPPVASGSGSASKNPRKKHRRTLEVLPPSGSSSSANPDHAHLLANKWMSATKLGELVASEGLVYKKGKFSAIEIKQINDAIEEYRITKGLSEQDINAIIFPADDKTKDAAFWSTITSALTLRPIIAVYHYVRRARHPMKGQGKWQPEEDARLIQAVTSLGQQWEKVAHLVGRMSSDCRDRYRNHIVNRETRVFGTWSSAEEEELTRIVLDMQKGKNFDNDIFWTKVSAKMGGTRTRQQCRIKWTDTLAKKHKADGQSSRWSSRDAFILIHKIDSLNVRDDTEIDWKTIPDSEFHWSAHVLQRRWLTMKKGVKGFEDMTHTDPAVETPRAPIDAESLRIKCQAIQSFAVPSPSFLKRQVSDRFEVGTNSTLITNATILLGKGNETYSMHGDLYLDKGIVKNIGSLSHLNLAHVFNLTAIDANGAWVTPGLVDLHTHLGLISAPFTTGAFDAVSTKGPILPYLQNIDGLNTHDDGFQLAVAGGVTSVQILAGSTNHIAGQTVVVKLRQTAEGSPLSMVLEPPENLNRSVDGSTRWRHLQQACGETPSAYGNRPDAIWSLRSAYAEAQNILAAQDAYCQKVEAGQWDLLGPFPTNLQFEMLVDVLRGKVKVTSLCQGAVDIDALVRLTHEFEFPVASIQHASEAWLVPELVNRTWGGAPSIALFATNYRGSEFAARVLADAGIPVVMKSAHPVVNSRYLLQEAQRAYYYGLDPYLALASITSVPAAALGLGHRIGSLEEGADADVVLWDSNPLQVGATPVHVWIDGKLQIPLPPRSDRNGPINVGAGKEGEKWARFPSVPDWEKERKQAIEYEGLPPLITQRLNRNVVFLNVRNVWSKSADGQIQQVHRPGTDLVSVTIRSGNLVCVGDRAVCPLDALDVAEYVDLDGGSIVPGMMTFGSPLGLEEIRNEPSTGNGPTLDAFTERIPAILNDPGAVGNAMDALMFGTRNALTAYCSGVTSGTVSLMKPVFFGGGANVIAGISTTFSTGASHAMERGAILQRVTALHVAIHRPDPFSRKTQPSVSSQIAGLRRLLSGWENEQTDTGRWFKNAAEGVVPLVIDVDNADIMATLLILKAEIENRFGSRMRMVFSGAAEAHILAKEIRDANVGVILEAKPVVGVWDNRRTLPGPPITNDTTLAVLFREGVKIGLKWREAQDVRNMREDITWAMLASNGLIGKDEVYALVSSNLEDLLGVTTEGIGDLVAYARGGPFETSSKTVAVISSQRGQVDLF